VWFYLSFDKMAVANQITFTITEERIHHGEILIRGSFESFIFRLLCGIWNMTGILKTGLNGREFEPRQGLGIFLFTTTSRPALGPTKPPIQWVPRALSLG
jgi:hypothetical protein